MKIHVTTDDGELIETFDSGSDPSAPSPWGHLEKPMPRASMIEDMRWACEKARRAAIRKATGGEQ